MNPFFRLHQNVGNQAMSRSLGSGTVQAKLNPSQPGDADESEADRAAAEGERHPPQLQRSWVSSGVQRAAGLMRAVSNTGRALFKEGQGAESRPAQAESPSGGTGQGQPLDPRVRGRMETAFGSDFSAVRVHDDSAAWKLSSSLNARAFTVGTDVYFARDQFRPSANDGERLLAHELTHVVQQQRNAPIDVRGVESPGSPAEREADAAASDVTAGRAAKPTAAAPRGIPRDVGFASRGEISDPHGLGFNAIYAKAGPDSKGAVLALASLETVGLFVNLDAYKKLDAPVRKSILALEPHAGGTGCYGWFDVMLANDPDFRPQLTPEQIRAGQAAYYAASREGFLEKKAAAAKADLSTLGRDDVEAKWKQNKYGLITAAQGPNHGIKAEALYQIRVKYWADKVATADSTLNAIIATEQRDHVDLSDTDTYRRAKQVNELGMFMMGEGPSALSICRLAEAGGKSLTLDELDQQVIDHAKFMEAMQILAAGLSMPRTGGGSPRVAKPGRSRPTQ